jgi:hypothetical protein
MAMANVEVAYIVDEDENRLKAAKSTWSFGKETAFVQAKVCLLAYYVQIELVWNKTEQLAISMC